jgi:colanic acid/amylovoran biosynthesis glycosyltransferase
MGLEKSIPKESVEDGSDLMKRKRLVLIAHRFPKISETFIINKFLSLLNRGWDVHMHCTESEPYDWQRFPVLQSIPDVRQRVHIDWPHRPRWLAALLLPCALVRGLWKNPKGSWRYLGLGWRKFGWQVFRNFYLDHQIVVLKPHILHWEFGTIAAERMYLRDLLDCLTVVSFRGYDLNFTGLEDPGFYQEVWAKAHGLHLLGSDLWRRAQRRGCPPEKLHALIPPAIDTGMFNPAMRANDSKVDNSERPLGLLSVGRLEWKKGYEYALQAVKLLVDQGILCEYRILGGGHYLGPLAFACHQLGLEGIVEFLGVVSHQEVKEQMLWADTFLHAAVSEGFCNAVLEAQAMMLPVVCTDADGLPENVVNGETGFVVPRRNPQALAEKVALLARNPELRQHLGQAGRQRVLNHFQLPHQVQAFEQFYQEVLNNSLAHEAH